MNASVGSVQNLPREAVVVLSRDLASECKYQWLVALAQSSSTDTWHRDVFFLHDEETPPSNATRLQTLESLGVTVARQPFARTTKGTWWSFAGAVNNGQYHNDSSGLTKQSFVMFANDHPEYDFFWFVEDDTFFTGKWSELFAVPYSESNNMNASADLVGSLYNRQSMAKYDPAFAKKWTEETMPSYQSKTFLGYNWGQTKETSLMFWWPVSRYSRNFVQALAASLDDPAKGATVGHHEIITANFCVVSPWCTFGLLPDSSLGVYTGYGWGPFKGRSKMSLEYLAENDPSSPGEIRLHRVYHPVKCDVADNQTGLKQLEYTRK
jgi:hypothetical protein